MQFRTATKNDANQIKDLIEANIVSIKEKKQGLIEYPQYNLAHYQKILSEKDTISQVLEIDKNIVAVALGYKKTILKKPYFKDDKIIQHLLKSIKYDFTYADLVVVREDHRKKGYGRMLMISFIDECPKQTIIGAVATKPIRNEKSLRLIESLRASKIDELSTKINKNEITFDIFEFDS